MTKKQKIVEKAEELVQFFSAVIKPGKNPEVKKGTFSHIDGVNEPGYWVTCYVFVSEESIQNQGETNEKTIRRPKKLHSKKSEK